MPDPVTLAVVGGVALTEGVRFLYSQAAELIRMRRESQRDSAAELLPVVPDLPAVFEGRLTSPVVDLDRIAQFEEDLLEARQGVAIYADGIDPINPSDQQTLVRIDALRSVVEKVLEQRLTFRGEARAPTGTRILVDAEDVGGDVVGVDGAVTGPVDANVRARRVTGSVVGWRADTFWS